MLPQRLRPGHRRQGERKRYRSELTSNPPKLSEAAAVRRRCGLALKVTGTPRWHSRVGRHDLACPADC